jgi:hypothetical protein
MEDSARVMENGRYIWKAIEHGEERSPTDLISLLERLLFRPFGQEIISADYHRAGLHSAMILRVFEQEYILAIALPERGRMFFPHADAEDSTGRTGFCDFRPSPRVRIGILPGDTSRDAKFPP